MNVYMYNDEILWLRDSLPRNCRGISVEQISNETLYSRAHMQQLQLLASCKVASQKLKFDVKS